MLGLGKIERAVVLIWVTILVVKKTPNFFSIFFTPVCACVFVLTRFHHSLRSCRVDSALLFSLLIFSLLSSTYLCSCNYMRRIDRMDILLRPPAYFSGHLALHVQYFDLRHFLIFLIIK